MTFASRLVRVNDAEYAPSAPLIIPALSLARFSGKAGTGNVSASSGNTFGSASPSISFGFTPTAVVVSGTEGNTFATVQVWSSTGFTVTLASRNAADTGPWTRGYTYIASE